MSSLMSLAKRRERLEWTGVALMAIFAALIHVVGGSNPRASGIAIALGVGGMVATYGYVHSMKRTHDLYDPQVAVSVSAWGRQVVIDGTKSWEITCKVIGMLAVWGGVTSVVGGAGWVGVGLISVGAAFSVVSRPYLAAAVVAVVVGSVNKAKSAVRVIQG